MPMPLSAMVSVLAALSGVMVILRSGSPSSSSGCGNRLVAQLVERIGGVGDQLAQEDVAVGIDRMHHEMQELGHLGLELVRLGPIGSGCFLCGLGHDVLANPGEIGMPYGLAAAQVKGTKKRPDPGPGRKLRTPHLLKR